MLGRGKADVIEVEPHRAHEIVGELRLLFLGETAIEHAVVHLRLFLDLFEQRHDVGAQRGEELVALRHRQPVLILAEPVVIGVLLRRAVVREADVRLHDLLEHRLEERKIARLLRAVPDVVGLHEQLLVGHALLHRGLLHVADVLEQQKHHALLLFIQLRLVRVEEFQQLDRFLAGGELVALLAQDAHGLAAVRRRAARRGGRAVVKEQAHGVIVGGHFRLQGHQGLLRFVESHRSSPRFPFSVGIIARAGEQCKQRAEI